MVKHARVRGALPLLLGLWLALPTVLAHAQDADADGISDEFEGLTNDFDADGIPDYLDADDDNDTRPTIEEEDGTFVDTDGDMQPDYLDRDEDNDGLIMLAEDVNGDGRLSSADDRDGDGVIDPLDSDDDNDGVPTAREVGQVVFGTPLPDTDGDGTPDHLDADDDGDGVPTLTERRFVPNADGNRNGIPAYLDASEVGPTEADSDADGIPDEVDLDDDDDGVPDEREQAGDSDSDGIPDRRDADDDGDGVLTKFELVVEEEPVDTDADGSADYLDGDDDNDGIPTRQEDPDPNGDGSPADARRTAASSPDYLNDDDDQDEVPTALERPSGVDVDTDKDGTPDHRDRDDDGDSRETAYENAGDSDGDGLVDRLDPDDDGDGIPTRTETMDPATLDYDGDGLLNHLDTDSDGDGIVDAVEGTEDRNGNGLPDYLDALGHAAMDAGVPDGSTMLDATLPNDAGFAADASGSDAGTGSDVGPGSGVPMFGPRNDGDGCSLSGERRAGATAFSWILATLLLVGGRDSCLRRATRRANAAAERARQVLCDAIVLGASFGSLVIQGCGEGKEPGWSGGNLDGGGGAIDASPSNDGMAGEAAIDAAADAAPSDDGGVSAECDVDRLTFPSIRGEGRSFGAAIAANRVQLLHLVPACGDVSVLHGARNLRSVVFPTSGPPEPLRDLFDQESCGRPRDPTVVSDDAGGFAALYVAPRERLELYLHPLANGEPQQLTDSPGSELTPAAAHLAGNEQATVLFLRAEREDEREVALISLTPGRPELELTRGALRQLTVTPTSDGGFVGWVSDGETSRGIHALRVDSLGAPLGESFLLSEAVGSNSSIAFASNGGSTAVVYTESPAGNAHELRFRELGTDGIFGAPRRLTSGNELVGEFALAAHRNGYAIVYRRLASELNPQVALRLLFVDSAGNLGGSRFLDDVGARGSALMLLSARDGRLVALWDDMAPAVGPLALDLHAARIHCR